MDFSQLVIATITWARDEAEELLLRKALTQLAQLNIPVYITDGGSTASFIEFLSGFSNFTTLTTPGKGVWAQAKNSLLAASNSQKPFIFYTEPDKADFFQYALPSMPAAFTGDEQTGIVMASRSQESFSTFPAFQQMTETTINNCCTEVTGLKTDFTYGPFILNKNIVPYFDQIKEDIGWGWRPYAFNVAHRLGYTVQSVEGDYNCPIDQREDSAKERIYRMKQLQQNIQGIVLSTSIEI